MPQLQSIVLTDRASTPVAHTFTPRDIDANGVGVVVESSGVPIGENRLTVSVKKRTTKFECQVRLTLPVVVTETVNGIASPVIVRTAQANLTVFFDEKSTEQERKDAIGMLASALETSKTLVNDTLVKLEGVY